MKRKSCPRARGEPPLALSYWRSSDCLVTRVLDRRAEQPIVQVRAAHDDQLRVQIDGNRVDARHPPKLRAKRVLAVGAAHGRNAVGDLFHRKAFRYTPPGYPTTDWSFRRHASVCPSLPPARRLLGRAHLG